MLTWGKLQNNHNHEQRAKITLFAYAHVHMFDRLRSRSSVRGHNTLQTFSQEIFIDVIMI